MIGILSIIGWKIDDAMGGSTSFFCDAFCVIGFAISGWISFRENQRSHLLVVALGFGLAVFMVWSPRLQWPESLFAIALMAAIGGGSAYFSSLFFDIPATPSGKIPKADEQQLISSKAATLTESKEHTQKKKSPYRYVYACLAAVALIFGFGLFAGIMEMIHTGWGMGPKFACFGAIAYTWHRIVK
jgi:hypothetical protein